MLIKVLKIMYLDFYEKLNCKVTVVVSYLQTQNGVGTVVPSMVNFFYRNNILSTVLGGRKMTS